MPSKMRTTVILTEKARHIKNLLAPAFGLKGILSVGIELFEKLPDDQKISRVANAIKSDRKQAVIDRMKARDLATKKQLNERKLERESSPRRQTILKKMKEQDLARAKVSQAQAHEKVPRKKKRGKSSKAS